MKTCPKCQLEYRDDSRTHCLVDGTPLTTIGDPRVGRLISGRFLIAAPIGTGGMATVYRGEEVATGRRVAIKVMHDTHTADADLRERFRREARNAAAISHENVVEILDAGETEDSHPYLVMELLEGQPLRALEAQGALPLWLVLTLGIQIARGLARAHDLGIVHRDLKPENVFVVERGGEIVAKLVDFGIARARDDQRMTQHGAILGTPAYLAPERVRGKDSGPSSDLYALGVVLFEMITGRLPFVSESLEGFLFHHLETEPMRPSALVDGCPPAFESLILRLLAKSPRERPVDAHQVVRELGTMQASIVSRGSRASLPGAITEPSGVTAPPGTEPVPAPSSTMGFERWVRRALILESMVRRAYAGTRIPPDVAQALEAFKGEVVRVESLRGARAVQQSKLEKIASRSRDARERLGRAMHALGRDLSEGREALERLKAELARRELEIADLEFQIHALRTNLGEAEAQAEHERAEAERVLLDTGNQSEAARRIMGDAARVIVAALRALPGGEGLLLDLD
ncbi:MAG: protein kinase [Sandaracinaceae bacterium]|nr:protein kinase [Sandaracinaceae bacterium]